VLEPPLLSSLYTPGTTTALASTVTPEMPRTLSSTIFFSMGSLMTTKYVLAVVLLFLSHHPLNSLVTPFFLD
jgi:hypothetical protein